MSQRSLAFKIVVENIDPLSIFFSLIYSFFLINSYSLCLISGVPFEFYMVNSVDFNDKMCIIY